MWTASRIKQTVYVDVPEPPYSLSIFPSLKGDTSRVPTRKRTVSEHHSPPLLKKHKVATSKPLVFRQPVTQSTSNACPEKSKVYIHCHQCSQKRDMADAIFCTVQSVKKTMSTEETGQTCTAKYCRTCLKNRYGEDIDALKSPEIFRCPKCRDICNCWRCRKSKGLAPLGKFPLDNREAGIHSAVPSSADGPKARKAPPSANAPMRKLLERKPAMPTSHKKSKGPTSDVNWTAIPTILDFEESQSRFQIREFVLRFAPVMQPAIPASQLAELEDLGCGLRSEHDELAKWVSEACVRSLVLGLLGMLLDSGDGRGEKPISQAIKDIRESGVNLNKIWAVLSGLRDAIKVANTKTDEDCIPLTFPDPLPPPQDIVIYNTRTTRSAGASTGVDSSVVITHPAQLVPVVEALVEAACDTNTVREELDRSAKEMKELARDVKDWIKSENERWDAERKDLGEDKEKVKSTRESHKRRVRNMENALKLISSSFAARFSPLGADGDGRMYWALSPGARERKDALEFIKLTISNTKEKKSRLKGRSLDEEARSAMQEWSWCIVIWGTAPVGSKIKHDERSPQWWGFYDPEDIRKVAAWVNQMGATDNEDDENHPSSLRNNLKEYAALLDWRLKEDKYEVADSDIVL